VRNLAIVAVALLALVGALFGFYVWWILLTEVVLR
jgi:hypothetical protein